MFQFPLFEKTMVDYLTFYIASSSERGEVTDLNEIRKILETGSEAAKISAMETILAMMTNGDSCSQLLMHIIRFVMPNQKNKLLKKLVLLYLELIPKLDKNGKLLQEFLLVCNALRAELQHPNEYVSGATLKFVSKLTEIELIEPLLPVIRQCLVL